MIRDTFDPKNITKSDMNVLADHLEDYLEVLQEVMIIPEDIADKKKDVDHARKLIMKLINKLRKGDASVFKDIDEWNTLS